MMRKFLLFAVCLFLAGTSCYGQAVSKADSLQLMAAADKFFALVDKPNRAVFKATAATQIFCLLCKGVSASGRNPYYVSSDVFFNNYLRTFQKHNDVRRARLKRGVRVHFEKQVPDFLLLLTTWLPNEYANGHEGAQIGLHFLKRNGVFYFAGIESIP